MSAKGIVMTLTIKKVARSLQRTTAERRKALEQRVAQRAIAAGRGPAYFPDAVTEYTLDLGLTRNGKIHLLCAMRKGNFTLAGPLRGKGTDVS